ncbi:MAG TPA: 30S ribosomal protein S13 [Candidatus Syntrophoarchaeum butanivorans]|uniref:Small ribosomal subunit protein uS13 n=1 Tax=Candidatus Syntropharchaeum butanivorans TaxID=1839936 RepID=A0A1F2P5K1_9EURY|nr:MAG: Ribosomal protein S13, archaeal [Candidatus Syntrophoarchaeum butanivorans]RJS71912.1 MAG: 30S ribosomal protein S13 [Candidatus Syntrophoarchaeum sp. WYZ-LMO15]HDM36813.1 30S ribosomal protein S13 [Candidatus Syntrophoarchaeum butanivorans]HEC57860.1 30S ribosomal protein S13 [Candidatus Syntrophoarchaeum butanivorans]
MEEDRDRFRHIVRIANTDLQGRQKVEFALTGIRGIGRRVARVIAKRAGVDPDAVMGYLPDDAISRLATQIEGEIDDALPVWMMNRQRDPFTGENRHLIAAESLMTLREDINFMKMIRCYRGIRHERGHKVRGQRTKSTGRKGAVVGVSRKKKK